MSKLVSVEFVGNGFWAYDVSLSILLAEMIGVAEETSELPRWLVGVLGKLRVHAVVPDLLLDLDFGLDEAQLDAFLTLLNDAKGRLLRRKIVTAGEAAEWRVLEDHKVLWRGADKVATAPIAELGEAMIQLIRGTIQVAPSGTWWCFGVEDGPRTIPMREPYGSG